MRIFLYPTGAQLSPEHQEAFQDVLGPKLSIYSHRELQLGSAADILRFADSRVLIPRTLTPRDFGLFSQRKLEGSQEVEILAFTDGSYLVVHLWGEHHYSEHSMDEARVQYIAYIPTT